MSRVFTPYSLDAQGARRRQAAYTKDDLVRAKIVFRLMFLVAFMAVLSIFYIWSRIQIVEYGYSINDLTLKQEKLIEENKKLKVEVATLKSPERIEKIAQEKLGMQTPTTGQMVELP